MGLDLEKLWTIREVADFLQTEESKIKYWVRIAQIPVIRLGRQVRFDPKDVKEWVDKLKHKRMRTARLNRLY